MSFEKTPDGMTIGRYYGAKAGTTVEPTSAIAAYIIDILEEKFPYIEDTFGNSLIKYYWFHSNEPKDTLDSPAVGISVAPMEVQTLASAAFRTGVGSIVPGSLMAAEIVCVIIAESPQMREDISSRMFKVLHKHFEFGGNDTPIFYFERRGFGDDRGFSTIDRFVMSSLWQNLTEDKYLKIDTYEVGYAENYIDEDDPVDWGVIGVIDPEFRSDNILFGSGLPSSRYTFRITFTPKNL